MKKSTLIALLLFVLSSFSAFSQGEWIEETIDPETGLRTGKIDINGKVYDIEPNTNLQGADLSNVDLQNANLQRAYLREAVLEGANLYGANLHNARLYKANLTQSNITKADLSNADMTETVLKSARLGGANLLNARLLNVNLFDVDLSGANLNDVSGLGPSFIGSIYSGISKGNYQRINNLESIVSPLEKQLADRNKRIEELENRLAIIETQLAGIDNANVIKELVEQVAELQERPTIEQVRDARAGSVVLTVEPDGNNITLGLTIEQSDNLTQWTKLDGEMTRTIPIPDGKKFYRFALDK